jgi:hypothetical protein
MLGYRDLCYLEGHAPVEVDDFGGVIFHILFCCMFRDG